MKTLFSIIIAFVVSVCVSLAQSGANLPAGGLDHVFLTGTAPQNGVNQVCTYTISALGAATVQFNYAGKTANLVLSGTEADNAAISAEALVAIGSMATTGTANLSIATTGTAARAIAVTFQGTLAKLALPTMTAAVTSGSITVSGTVSTPGVTADGRVAGKGSLVIDKADGYLYQNKGTPPNPNWVLISGTGGGL